MLCRYWYISESCLFTKQKYFDKKNSFPTDRPYFFGIIRYRKHLIFFIWPNVFWGFPKISPDGVEDSVGLAANVINVFVPGQVVSKLQAKIWVMWYLDQGGSKHLVGSVNCGYFSGYCHFVTLLHIELHLSCLLTPEHLGRAPLSGHTCVCQFGHLEDPCREKVAPEANGSACVWRSP